VSNSKKINSLEYESIHILDDLRIFLSAECENYPWKRGDKVRGEKKIVFDFFCENGLESTTKTIPVGILADITFFSPFRGLKVRGEIFYSIFFS